MLLAVLGERQRERRPGPALVDLLEPVQRVGDPDLAVGTERDAGIHAVGARRWYTAPMSATRADANGERPNIGGSARSGAGDERAGKDAGCNNDGFHGDTANQTGSVRPLVVTASGVCAPAKTFSVRIVAGVPAATLATNAWRPTTVMLVGENAPLLSES